MNITECQKILLHKQIKMRHCLGTSSIGMEKNLMP